MCKAVEDYANGYLKKRNEELAIKMLNDNMPIDKIQDYTSMSIKQIEEIKVKMCNR